MSSEFPVHPTTPDAGRSPLPTAATTDRARREAPPVEAVIELDWRRWGAAVLRHKWLVLLVTVIGTAGGFGVSRFLRPTYVAQATLWIDLPADARPGDQGPNPIQSAQLLGPSGWVDLLKSHVVLDSVVDELRLYLTAKSRDDSTVLASFQHAPGGFRPGAYRLDVADTGGTFTLSTTDGVSLQRGHVGDSIGPDLGFRWAPPATELTPGRTVEFALAFPPAVADRLSGTIRVHTDLLEGKVGNFISVELRGPGPALIRAIVNGIARRFVAVAVDLKRQKLTELTSILNEQLLHARQNLQTAEADLKAFRVQSVTELGADAASITPTTQFRDPVFAGLVELRVTRQQLRRDREAIERVLAASDSGVLVDALGMIESVQHSLEFSQVLRDLTERQAELRALRFRYSDDVLPVRHLIGEVATLEHRTIPTLARQLSAALAAREAEFAQRVDSASGALRGMPPLAIEDARRQREVTFAEQLAANIQQRYSEARLAEVSSIPDLRILDPATAPLRPLYNLAPALVLLAFVASLGAGLFTALGLDRRDPKLRYPHQVTQAMGLSILGVVPHVERRNGSGEEGAAGVIEALRGVRLNVAYAHGTGPLLVSITSPGRSDGKSFVASNLALAFASVGYRTLLIDGDVRRGGLHRILTVSRKPGLTDVLAGDVTAEAALQRTPYSGLSFIGCGSRRHRGPELLSSAAMPRLVASLRPHYEAIIVDTPPLVAGVDAFALGTVTGALVLVLRAGMSDRDVATAKLDVLDRLPVRLLEAVVNDVRAGGDYRQYSYYLAGYEATDEDELREPAQSLLRDPQ